MRTHPRIEFCQLGGQGLMVDQQLSQSNKGADDHQAHLNSPGTSKHGGGHKRTMLCKGPGKRTSASTARLCPRKLRCQTAEFLGAKLKAEIIWKTSDISLYRLVQAKGGHIVECGEVAVENHTLVAQDEDS